MIFLISPPSSVTMTKQRTMVIDKRSDNTSQQNKIKYGYLFRVQNVNTAHILLYILPRNLIQQRALGVESRSWTNYPYQLESVKI
jgi:hypothetical protein